MSGVMRLKKAFKVQTSDKVVARRDGKIVAALATMTTEGNRVRSAGLIFEANAMDAKRDALQLRRTNANQLGDRNDRYLALEGVKVDVQEAAAAAVTEANARLQDAQTLIAQHRRIDAACLLITAQANILTTDHLNADAITGRETDLRTRQQSVRDAVTTSVATRIATATQIGNDAEAAIVQSKIDVDTAFNLEIAARNVDVTTLLTAMATQAKRLTDAPLPPDAAAMLATRQTLADRQGTNAGVAGLPARLAALEVIKTDATTAVATATTTADARLEDVKTLAAQDLKIDAALLKIKAEGDRLKPFRLGAGAIVKVAADLRTRQQAIKDDVTSTADVRVVTSATLVTDAEAAIGTSKTAVDKAIGDMLTSKIAGIAKLRDGATVAITALPTIEPPPPTPQPPTPPPVTPTVTPPSGGSTAPVTGTPPTPPPTSSPPVTPPPSVPVSTTPPDPKPALQLRLVAFNKDFNPLAANKDFTAVDAKLTELEPVALALLTDAQAASGTAGKAEAVFEGALKARYGFAITVPVGMTNAHLDRVYKLLGDIPADHVVHDKLKKLVYEVGKGGGGSYNKTTALIKMGDIAVDKTEEYTVGGVAVPINSFDVTTLHEVGHSVDNKFNIMGGNGSKAGCGAWTSETSATVLAAFVSHFKGGNVVDPTLTDGILTTAMTAALSGGTKARPAGLTNEDWAKLLVVLNKAVAIRAANKPWWKAPVDIGGTVYQEAYDGRWVSYNLASRTSTYTNKYQWRAPGEWFAELYAVTWLKKKSPPGGVDRAAAEYMWAA